MKRLCIFVCLAVALTAESRTAHAGWTDFWTKVKLDWHRMNCWPEPFKYADRKITRSAYAAMIDKGWQLNNTIGDYHFNPETQDLTRAGRLKVRWIVTEAPLNRRMVFVLRAHNEEATSIRVDSVQRAVADLVPAGPLPEVVKSDMAPRGWPAEQIDAVHRSFQDARPAPVLSTGGSGGGGGE